MAWKRGILQRAGALALAAAVGAGAFYGCGRVEEGTRMTTGRTVRQQRYEAARGLGGYRSVEMPEKARRNLIEAVPDAAGAASYVDSLGDK